MKVENLDETLIADRAQRDAEFFLERYPDQMEALHASPLAQARGITSFDMAALGEQFVQFETYKQFVSEAGTAVDLGKLPTIALDIITAVYGASVVPIICSVQPIEEERGTIYYKQTKALVTRGNVTAGQVIRDPSLVPAVYPNGYAGEMINTASLGNTAGGTTSYSGTLASYPVRPNTVRFDIPLTAGALKAIDDGEGNLLGIGCSGTIVYSTGAWTLELAADPAETVAMTANYGVDFEAGATIPSINFGTRTTDIQAEIWVLQTQVGMFKAFSMQKRFGKIAEDEMVNDLTNEITAELGNSAIARLTAALPSGSSENWSKTPSAGLAYALHKLELKDKISQADGRILDQAGRGSVNVLIAGSSAASILAGLPGFEKSTVNASGPAFYGTLDGMIVLRAPNITTNHIYCVYKGTGYFDAPIVYSPYMPLFVANTLPVPNNVLQKQGFAAVWGGLKAVSGAFVTRIVITS